MLNIIVPAASKTVHNLGAGDFESVILSVHKERTRYDQQPTYVEICHRNGNGNITMRPTERLVDERVFGGK